MRQTGTLGNTSLITTYGWEGQVAVVLGTVAYRLIVCRVDSANTVATMQVKGSTPSTGQPGTFFGAPGGLVVGSANGGTAPSAIDVVEVVHVSGLITAGNERNVIEYLSEKFLI